MLSSSKRFQAIVIGVLVGGLLSLFTVALPQGRSAQLIRMGVVNWEQVVMEYENYQSELKELQRRRMRVLEYIKGQGEDVDEEALREGNEAQLNEEMQKIYQDTLKQIDQRRTKIQKQYQQRIYSAIRQEAIEQGYSLVLSENEVLYASQEYTDLTHDVLERLNQNESSDTNAAPDSTAGQ
jgi:Skp family chaperone for outer membrane proteins